MRLDARLEQRATLERLTLLGASKRERYTDADLAVLAEFPALTECELARHPITRVPPLRPELRRLSISDAPALRALDGIERLVGLQDVTLTTMPMLDWETACAQLAELPDLTVLRLGDVAMTALPGSILQLASLRELAIDGAPALDHADAFGKLAEMPWLRRLELSPRTPITCPDLAPLVRLEALTLAEVGEVDPSLGLLGDLRELELRFRVRGFPRELGRLGKLRSLVAMRAKLVAFPEELCDCAALERLVIDAPIQALPERIGVLAKLRELDVKHTRLTSLPGSIGELASLRTLALPLHMRTTHVPAAIGRLALTHFDGPREIGALLTLARLETPTSDHVALGDPARLPADFGDPTELFLDLPLHAAPIPQLSALRRLRKLTIDTGNLGDAFARLAAAPALHTLVVRGRHLRLPDELGELAQIAELVIDPATAGPDPAGYLEALPDAIAGLASLRQLRIGANELAALPDAIGELAALEALYLEGKPTELPDAIGRLARLRTLSLTRPSLARFPPALARCGALTGVWIRWRCLADLAALADVPSLRTLSLYKLEGLAIDAVLACTQLDTLELTDSSFGELPPAIGNLASLRTLVLDGTSITRLPAELAACTQLRKLVVSHQRLDATSRERIKRCLPDGRWKKHARTRETTYERTDPG